MILMTVDVGRFAVVEKTRTTTHRSCSERLTGRLTRLHLLCSWLTVLVSLSFAIW